MRTINLIQGLQILMPYYDKPTGFNVGADYDVIYGYATSEPLPEDDVKRMIELGWHQEYDGLDYSKDFTVEDYDPDESWHAYV